MITLRKEGYPQYKHTSTRQKTLLYTMLERLLAGETLNEEVKTASAGPFEKVVVNDFISRNGIFILLIKKTPEVYHLRATTYGLSWYKKSSMKGVVGIGNAILKLRHQHVQGVA